MPTREEMIQKLSLYRDLVEKNPGNREAVVGASRILVELGQFPIAAQLLSLVVGPQARDWSAAQLVETLVALDPDGRISAGGKILLSRVPDSFSEITGYLDSIHGWLLKSQERYLFEKVKSLPDGSMILELGCNHGKSTAAMAFACIGTRKRIYSIDTFTGNDGLMGKSWDFESTWRGNLERFGLEGYVTPIRGFTFDVLPDRGKYPAPDFVFVDASHQYEDVLEDFRLIYPYVKKEGWIAFHDVEPGWPGPWRVWWEYATHLLSDFERADTLAAGRKSGDRPFGKHPVTTPGFSFAAELLKEQSRLRPGDKDFLQAVQTSLAGKKDTASERLALIRAEMEITRSASKSFESDLTEMVNSHDARVDGQIHLWQGLVYMMNGKWSEAAASFDEVTRVSYSLPRERVAPYVAMLPPGTVPGSHAKDTGVFLAKPRPKPAPSVFQDGIGAEDTVLILGSGKGELARSLACGKKVGIEPRREMRKDGTNLGIDSVAEITDLPEHCAQVAITENTVDTVGLDRMRALFSRLRYGSKVIFIAEGQAESGRVRDTLRETGFTAVEVLELPGGGMRYTIRAVRS